MRTRGIGSHTKPNNGASVCWLTPPSILQALGEFDLDPCPCLPQPFSTARRILKGDGLKQKWKGRVWLNPPYGPNLGTWLSRLADHGDGIAICFARTETRAFFSAVWGKASALLFIQGRLHFHRPDGLRAKGNSGGPSVLIAYGKRNAIALKRSNIAGVFIPAHLLVGFVSTYSRPQQAPRAPSSCSGSR
jgi:hypothetical protein